MFSTISGAIVFFSFQAVFWHMLCVLTAGDSIVLRQILSAVDVLGAVVVMLGVATSADAGPDGGWRSRIAAIRFILTNELGARKAVIWKRVASHLLKSPSPAFSLSPTAVQGPR